MLKPSNEKTLFPLQAEMAVLRLKAVIKTTSK
jgi:hypothetical protein